MKSLNRIFALVLFALTACGGGGGASVSTFPTNNLMTGISAADGSAMAYGLVTINSLVDTSTITSTADVNGNLALPSSGLTYPAIVKVQSLNGGKANFGYVATSTQTSVPVNPLTTLILSIASRGNPVTINSVAQLSPVSLATAKISVNAIFRDIFTAFSIDSNTDLLTTSFPTDHTGIDLILDTINLKFDSFGNPTFCTKLLNTCKTLNLTNLDTTSINITQVEINSLKSAPIGVCSSSISSFTSTQITTDAALFSTDFLNSGQNSQQYRNALSTALGSLLVNFSNPIFTGIDPSNNYIFDFDYSNKLTNEYIGTFTMPFKISGNNCVMAGDQLPFRISATSQVTFQTRVDGTSNPAVTTPSPVRGIVFGAGSSAVDNATTVLVGGSPIPVQKLRFFMCDATNNCSTPLLDMIKGGSGGFYYTPNSTNTLPIINYNSVGISTADTFYNGNSNPILVRMFDSNSNFLKEFRLKLRGGFITVAELNDITLPSVANVQTILNTSSELTNPSLNFVIPKGIIVRSASIGSGSFPGQVTFTSRFVMSGSNISLSIPRTINVNNNADFYRSIQVNASTVTGTPISIKYVWSTCTGCT